MADGDDLWGCIGLGAVALFGGWWLYNNYEIRPKEPQSPDVPLVYRPTGWIEIGTLENGSVWRLDADSVTGPRKARQAWITEDHSNNKSEKARSAQTLYRINCETTAYRALSMVFYDKDGRVLRTLAEKELGQQERFAPPRTFAASIVEAGCHRGFEEKPLPVTITPAPPISGPRQTG